MKKIAAQQVQQEKEEGEKRLREAVVKAEQKCEKEKLAAVKAARAEVQRAAEKEAQNVAVKEEEKRKALALSAENEKQVSKSLVKSLY